MGARKVEVVPRPPVKLEVSESEKTVIGQAAQVIRQSGRGKLPEAVIFDILLWTAEGCKWDVIIKRGLKRHSRMLSRTTIETYQKKFAPKIRELTAEWEREAVNAGLARKSVRISKLQKIAEAMENRILPEGQDGLEGTGTDLKALVSEYRELLKQIGIEVGDIDEGSGGDIAFINLNNEELAQKAAAILGRNKDLAVILSEKAGTRPRVPESVQEQEDAHEKDLQDSQEDAENAD